MINCIDVGSLRKEVDEIGNIRWYNADNRLHRLDGPAVEYVDGYKAWFQNGERHRLDGPAVEDANGYKAWYQNGKFHRLDGPAIEFANGDKYWYQNGDLHRLNGPAIERTDGYKAWWQNDKLHRLDGPAAEYAHGTKQWWIEGKHLTETDFNIHPKVLKYKTKNDVSYLRKEVDEIGTIRWYNADNRLHRLDGPAVEYANGYKAWYQNGKFHRLDGPAVEYADGSKEWYQNGEYHRLDGPAVEYVNGGKEWWIEGKHLTEDEFNQTKESRLKVNSELDSGGPGLSAYEPPPIKNDGKSMHDLVSQDVDNLSVGLLPIERLAHNALIEDMKVRKQFGLDKYGTILQAFNGRNALVDSYQESLDLLVYLKQAQEENEFIEASVKSLYFDTIDLAVELRRLIGIQNGSNPTT